MIERKCTSQYAVGDLVRAARDIWQEPNEDHPLSQCAKGGDILEIREVRVGNPWTYVVAHPERSSKDGFGVCHDEIKSF